MRRNYRNRIVKDRDGVRFSSKLELNRWRELLLLQSAGKIKDLKRQVPIILEGRGGTVFYDSKRAAKVVVDFSYFDNDSRETVYEDAKGFETDLFKLKRAIAKAMGIDVVLVR